MKDFLEIAYFLSGPALVFIAYLALSQIKVTKSQLEEQRNALRINSRRDALKLTSEQITKYGVEIIPLFNKLDKKIFDEKIVFFEKSKVIISNNKISVKLYNDDVEFDKLSIILSDFLQVMNPLEGFASYVISGIVDEKVIYHSLSTTYCNSVRTILPLLVIGMRDENSFTSIVKLFLLWNERIETDNIKKEKEKLEKLLKDKHPSTIEILGSEIN